MPTTTPRSPLAWLAAPPVAVTVVAGVWVAGGVLTDDFVYPVRDLLRT